MKKLLTALSLALTPMAFANPAMMDDTFGPQLLKKEKAEPKEETLEGKITKDGKKFILTSADGTVYAIMGKKALAKVKDLTDKKVKMTCSVVSGKKKVIKAIASVEESAA